MTSKRQHTDRVNKRRARQARHDHNAARDAAASQAILLGIRAHAMLLGVLGEQGGIINVSSAAMTLMGAHMEALDFAVIDHPTYPDVSQIILIDSTTGAQVPVPVVDAPVPVTEVPADVRPE